MMMLNYRQDFEGIVWLRLDQPDSRVNTLSSAMLVQLENALEQIGELPNLRGLVIESAKKSGFIAGADIKEFDQFQDAEVLRVALTRAHALMDRLASFEVPTVACIHGFCLGGGLELALACRHRVATADAKLGFPEVKLGLFPGFGGTGRCIERSGALAGMTAMLTGKTYKAYQARRLGWVDRVLNSPDRLRWAARKLILAARPQTKPGLSHRLMQWQPVRKVLAKKMRQQTLKKALPEHYPAPFALIELFEREGACSRSMRQGEIERFPALMLSRTSQSLRRIFLAAESRKVRQPDFKPRRVHIIGAGVMGGDIAAWAAFSGYEVTLQDLSAEAIEPALERAKSLFKKRLRTQPAINNALGRIRADVQGQGIALADVIIEAVVERLEVKSSLFQSLEQTAKPTAILATNTSSIPLEDIAQNMQDPTRLVGIHFFNPVAMLPLVEVVQGKQTASHWITGAQAWVTSIRKTPLVVKSSPGFLVNRVLASYMMNALDILESGTSADQIDAAAVSAGMPMGPIELMDSVGLDICLAVAEQLALTQRTDTLLHQKVQSGQLGRKSNQGFYTWPLKRSLPQGDAALGRRLLGIICDTTLTCVEEGIVDNAEAADIGIIMGTGFAPFLGGPIRARELGAL